MEVILQRAVARYECCLQLHKVDEGSTGELHEIQDEERNAEALVRIHYVGGEALFIRGDTLSETRQDYRTRCCIVVNILH